MTHKVIDGYKIRISGEFDRDEVPWVFEKDEINQGIAVPGYRLSKN